MKIKQVCELTGLTDRTIRYYIEEGLLSPHYTENYMGRRAYDFSDSDVTALNHIATLRKFGFTVEEIRRILTDPQESVAIVAEVRGRKEESVRQERANLDALARLDGARAYTVAELAEALNEPVQAVGVPKEDRWLNWREKLVAWLKATPVWVMGCAPLLLCGIGHIGLLMDFRYPRFDLSMLGSYVPLLLVSIAPAILWLIGWFTRFWYGARRGLKWVLAVICVLWLPVTWIATFFIGWASPIYTETTNPAHYLQLRQYETARDDLIYAFFPAQPRTVQYVKPDRVYEVQPVEVRYHYRESENVDRRCEIYAEWTLPVEELAAERDRVAALFASRDWWDTQTVQQGTSPA